MSPIWKSIRGSSGLKNLPAQWLAEGYRKAAVMAALTLLTLATSGCSVISNGFTALSKNNAWNESVTLMRTHSQSARSWLCRKQNFLNERHLQDFRKGYRAGYEAACDGAKPCPPAFPPSEYWGWEFQSAEGQARTAAWFAGYPHGTRAAREEGNAQLNQLQMPGALNTFQNTDPMTQPGMIYQDPYIIGPTPSMQTPNMSGAPVPAPFPAAGGGVVELGDGIPAQSSAGQVQ